MNGDNLPNDVSVCDLDEVMGTDTAAQEDERARAAEIAVHLRALREFDEMCGDELEDLVGQFHEAFGRASLGHDI